MHVRLTWGRRPQRGAAGGRAERLLCRHKLSLALPPPPLSPRQLTPQRRSQAGDMLRRTSERAAGMLGWIWRLTSNRSFSGPCGRRGCCELSPPISAISAEIRDSAVSRRPGTHRTQRSRSVSFAGAGRFAPQAYGHAGESRARLETRTYRPHPPGRGQCTATSQPGRQTREQQWRTTWTKKGARKRFEAEG